MATWNSRGLRGSTLEELINRTNDLYLEHNLCLVQKIPTPITPIKMDKSHNQITLAYFEQKSTVDYIGVAQSVPICFDAKECAKETFALANIHPHQVSFMDNFEKQGGVSFFIIYYTGLNKLYYLRFKKFMEFWDRMNQGGRKSFRFEEIEEDYFITPRSGILVPYLDTLSKDLTSRE